MKRYYAIALVASSRLILCGIITAQIRTAAVPDDKLAVSSFGGCTLSRNITSLWLAGPDQRPRLLVFFTGPDDWHKTLWNMDSKFEKGKSGWAELRSEVATLHLEVDPETGQAGVQRRKFNIRTSNTFLVLHMGELLVAHTIIPLGVFELPTSDDNPASLLLLQAHPELTERINRETRAHEFNSGTPNQWRPSLEAPCSAKRINLLQTNTPSTLFRTSLFPIGTTTGRSLDVSYTLPC
jgi:hypothetical protein